MILHRAYLIGAVSIIGGAFFSGCVQVGPKDFNIPKRGIVAAIENPIAAPRACTCRPLPPIPEVVHINIEPGKSVIADPGGESLLRAYIGAREWTKSKDGC